MQNAVEEYAKLFTHFLEMAGIKSGQMFGKACITVYGKAFVAQHQEWVVSKLTGEHHRTALGLAGAALWDPSGEGRPMKEWVAIPATAHKHFPQLARASCDYVSAGR